MFGRAAGKQGVAKEYAVVPGKVNEDLQKERQKCTFDNLELTYYLDGGVEKYKDRKERGLKKKTFLLFSFLEFILKFYVVLDCVFLFL